MVKRIDYTLELIEAARSVLLEIMRVLGEYQDDIVIVGGWVPELLLSQADEEHIGSIDVDLALNHRRLDEAGYKTILELLLARGYVQANHGQRHRLGHDVEEKEKMCYECEPKR
jgi:tRNA nucleotidyltransferase/poly(A) polymerase